MQTTDQFVLPMRTFPIAHDSERVQPLITPLSSAHYEALKEGRLLLQQCDSCSRRRLTFGPRCLWCGCGTFKWKSVQGKGKVHSWTRYHRSYLSEFEDLQPYVVVAAKLDEGPVVFGRLVDTHEAPSMNAPLSGVIERWQDDFCVLSFVLTGEST